MPQTAAASRNSLTTSSLYVSALRIDLLPRERRWQRKRYPLKGVLTIGPWGRWIGGVRGIRTLDTGLSPYNALAGRPLRPLGHHSGGARILPRRAARVAIP